MQNGFKSTQSTHTITSIGIWTQSYELQSQCSPRTINLGCCTNNVLMELDPAPVSAGPQYMKIHIQQWVCFLGVGECRKGAELGGGGEKQDWEGSRYAGSLSWARKPKIHLGSTLSFCRSQKVSVLYRIRKFCSLILTRSGAAFLAPEERGVTILEPLSP